MAARRRGPLTIVPPVAEALTNSSPRTGSLSLLCAARSRSAPPLPWAKSPGPSLERFAGLQIEDHADRDFRAPGGFLLF